MDVVQSLSLSSESEASYSSGDRRGLLNPLGAQWAYYILPLFAAFVDLKMTACSTLSSGHPYSAREFMARSLQPYSHCTAGVQ